MNTLVKDELTVEELTAEAMQLLDVNLDELYVLLGCQLAGAARPARVAGLLSYQSALRSVVEARDESETEVLGAPVVEWGRSFLSIMDELKEEGMRFVSVVAEELSKGLSGKQLLELATEITASTMQVLVLIVTAVLKLPRHVEAVSATVAAIFCKAAMREIYA